MKLQLKSSPRFTQLLALSAGLAIVLPEVRLSADSLKADLPQTPAQLFRLTNIWTVHLKFTADQWKAMEPEGGPGGPGGPFGGPFGGRRGGGPGEPEAGPDRGGPGGPGGPPGDFGPAMFLAPAFLRNADLNHDGKLSSEEFGSLAEKWFAAWDKTHSGKLTEDQVRTGLNQSFSDGQGPGRPGGPGGRGPGMMLQGPEGKRNGLASSMGIEFDYVHGDLEFEGASLKDVAVRYKGNGTFLESRGTDKRSLKVELNKYVKGQKLAGVSKLNLHNCVTDASWMNEVLAYQLYRDAKVPAPRSAYARVFVTVPGKFDHKYLGLYSLVEDVDRSFTEKNFNTRKGAIFKPVTPNLFADLGPEWASYRQTYDPKIETSKETEQRLMDLCRLVTSADDPAFARGVGEFIDLEELARFMAVMVFLSDMDGIFGPGQNLYLFLPHKGDKFVFIPWDQDHSFGQFPMRGTQEQRENLSILKPWDGQNRFLERVFKVEAFKKAYLARLTEYAASLFQPERFAQQVNLLAAAIRPAVKEESAEKLVQFDQAVAGKTPEAGGFGPFHGEGVKPIKPFVEVRARSISDQVTGKSQGQTIGGFGFGRPGGGPGGPDHLEDFGPGNFLAGPFMAGLDSNKDGRRIYPRLPPVV